jgi:Fic family protein
MFIYELENWPKFLWDIEGLSKKLAIVRHNQGRLIGRLSAIGIQYRREAVLSTLTADVIKSSEIEGEILGFAEVRSSVAHRLGFDIGGLTPTDRYVEGVVDMMLDATQNYHDSLDEERLFGWHAALFPTGRSGMQRIRVGSWRDDNTGPMQVVSSPMGRKKVHYQAPAAERLHKEMKRFLGWFNKTSTNDLVLNAGLAHFWFVTIHPFDDGNGRIARAIADMTLARSEQSQQRYYSMSAQIQSERNQYYAILEQTQKATLDITPWLDWFLGSLDRAIAGAETALETVLHKARFWENHASEQFNDRQRKLLNSLIDGFKGKLTSSKWAKIAKCSQDTAYRDIVDLVERNILSKDPAGGRSTSYSFVVK